MSGEVVRAQANLISGHRRRRWALACCALLAACAAAPVSATPVPSSAIPVTKIPIPNSTEATVLPTAQPSPTPTIAPSATPLPTRVFSLCSPLEGVSLQELPGLVAGNTYQTPMPARDSGHPGVDFAFYSHGDRKTMLGLPLLAAMNGVIAAVLPDRYPYGNAVILEVALESIPHSWQAALNWPVESIPITPDPRLTCPDPLILPAWNVAHRSLYLMYGHLRQPSPLKVGDAVSCGQVVGEAGTSGASVNTHLHFEARLGPSGARFSSMGHYDTHTTAEERGNYCLWRVSGWFQVIDPLPLLAQQP